MKEEVRLKDTVRFVWSHWRRTPGSVAWIAGGIFGAVLCDISLPGVARNMASAVQEGHADKAMTALGTFLALGAGFTALWQLGYRRHEHMVARHMHNVAAEAFAKVQQASSDWHANSFAGSTVRKITRGFWAFGMFGDTVITGIFPTVVLITGSLGLMLVQWPLMGLCSSASVLVYVTASVLLARHYVSPANRAAVKQDTALSATIADAVSCNATVKAFGAEQREEERLEGSLKLWQAANLRCWLRRQNMFAVLTALSLLNQMAILGTPIWLWQHGKAGPADVAYALTAFFLLNGPIKGVVNHVQNLQRALNDLEDVVALSRMQVGVGDAANAAPAVVTRGEVRFDDVTFRYAGQDAPIYRNFSLVIRPGERVGLVGASGSGKSTFVKLLQRLYDVEGGQVLVDGQDIRTVTQSSLRSRIALVPQDPALFHRSLLENIRYGRVDATEEEVVQAAKEANAHSFISSLPQGYATLVGERGVKLSGGERQRVAIARAILADAPLLVLDEATSSLDSVSEAQIQEALDRLMLGRTTLVLAHRLSTLRSVDRILVFNRGQVVEEGSHHALLQREDGRYRQLHETQQLGLEAVV